MRLFGVLYIKKSQNKDTTVGKIRSLHTTVEITMYEISVGLRQKNKKVLLVCSLVPYRTLHIPNYYSTEE